MIRQRNFLIILVLAILMSCLASQALAEVLYQRTGRVNNVGFGMQCYWGGPLRTKVLNNHFQLPAGSGNFFTNDVWLMSMSAVRDLDGDGLPEDTLRLNKDSNAQYAGLNYNLIADLAAQGLNMETATSHTGLGGTDISQVWDSLDPESISSWPWEAREPKGSNGEPVIHGAQTLVSHCADVFNIKPAPIGWYQCWSLYFLNFGESNNMIYGHVWMQNATMYFKFNDLYKDNVGALYPDGLKWFEIALANNIREPRMGGGPDLGWAFHPAKEITVHYSLEPTISSFSPPEPFQLGWKMLRKPTHKGETMKLTNINCWDVQKPFGFEEAKDFNIHYSFSQIHRGMLGLGQFDMFPGAISPFTDKRGMIGWPGMLDESEPRFNQWLWGGNSKNTYTMFAAHHDVEPRDSTSWDFVIMCTPANGKVVVRPELTLDNIDDPGMQEAFADQEHYAEVAQTVYGSGYLTPATPLAPPLTIIPGDREVTITWSDMNFTSPDPYYYFLEEKSLNPDGHYKEYDFEGFRVYRSFVGPNDSHSELLADFSNSAGNLQFHYIDRRDDDQPYFRMRNGMKVWYAVVPYDRNYDPLSGAMFSLPLPTSGKTWNRPGAKEYNVVPRSDASNFVSSTVDGEVAFVPAYGNPVTVPTLEINGNGDGTFAEAPQYLVPIASFEFNPVNNERITTAKTLNVVTSGTYKVYGNRGNGTRTFQITESGGGSGYESNEFIVRAIVRPSEVFVVLNGPVDSDGTNYAVNCLFERMSDKDFRENMFMIMDAGGYTAAIPEVETGKSEDRLKGGFGPAHPGLIRAGRYTVTWQSGGSGLTLEVKDVTRGYTLPFVEYPDQNYGWGFVTIDAFGGSWGNKRGTLYDEAQNQVPFSQRSIKMVSSLPTDNTEEFGVWVNGLQWTFVGSPDEGVITSMPAVGTVMTIDNAWGLWNSDKTKFTQWPDPPFPGDKWEIKITSSTLNPEDANLSKIRVIPNPYIATSYLDLSPLHRRIEFVNLPDRCTIRVYSLGGNLVNVLNHIGANRQGWGDYTEWDRLTQGEPKVYSGYENHSGTEPWNLRNRFGQTVASGLYFFHVTDSRGETYTGKFYVVL